MCAGLCLNMTNRLGWTYKTQKGICSPTSQLRPRKSPRWAYWWWWWRTESESIATLGHWAKVSTEQDQHRSTQLETLLLQFQLQNCPKVPCSAEESECPKSTKPFLDLSHEECIQQSQCQELLLDNEIADPEHCHLEVSHCLLLMFENAWDTVDTRQYRDVFFRFVAIAS